MHGHFAGGLPIWLRNRDDCSACGETLSTWIERSRSVVVGSVFASVFGPHLRDSLAALSVPTDVAAKASESLGAALAMAAQASPEMSGRLMVAAKDAFVSGLSVGCYVAVAAVVIGAVVTMVFLPARHSIK